MEEYQCSFEPRPPFMLAFNSNFAAVPGLQFRNRAPFLVSTYGAVFPGPPFLAA